MKTFNKNETAVLQYVSPKNNLQTNKRKNRSVLDFFLIDKRGH